jgi:large repetitive protein
MRFLIFRQSTGSVELPPWEFDPTQWRILRNASIYDDEPRSSISDVSKQEGKKGQTILFTFTVTLSAAYDQAVTIFPNREWGRDDDYVAKSGTLTFAPGETTKTITIEVKGDSKKEANETFYLDLFGNSSNSLLNKSRGIGTILNDD